MTQLATPVVPDVAVVRRPARVRLLWFLVALALLLAFMTASVAFGSRTVGWSDILAAFGGADETMEQAAVTKRIPRTLLAVCVGAALGLAGAVMQGVTRNPLGDPSILGVSMGASLAVVTAHGHLRPLHGDRLHLGRDPRRRDRGRLRVRGRLARPGRGHPAQTRPRRCGHLRGVRLADQRPRARPQRRRRRLPVLADRRRRRSDLRQHPAGPALPRRRLRDLPAVGPGPELPRPRRRPRGGTRRTGRTGAGHRRARLGAALRRRHRGRRPDRLRRPGRPARVPHCSSGSTTGGCCRSPRSSARRC